MDAILCRTFQPGLQFPPKRPTLANSKTMMSTRRKKVRKVEIHNTPTQEEMKTKIENGEEKDEAAPCSEKKRDSSLLALSPLALVDRIGVRK